MDAVLGHRPTTRPSILLDTSAEHPDEVEEEGLEENEQEDEPLQNSNLSTTEDTQPSPLPLPTSSGIKGRKGNVPIRLKQ